jgi:hypothetical protein
LSERGKRGANKGAIGGLAGRFRAAMARRAVIVRPPTPEKEASAELAKLAYADLTQNSFDTKKALTEGRYEDVMRALYKATAPDALNNLGCAYAWLALTLSTEPYWGSAIEAFNRSIASAGKGDTAKKRRERAQANIETVRRASGLG